MSGNTVSANIIIQFSIAKSIAYIAEKIKIGHGKSTFHFQANSKKFFCLIDGQHKYTLIVDFSKKPFGGCAFVRSKIGKAIFNN